MIYVSKQLLLLVSILIPLVLLPSKIEAAPGESTDVQAIPAFPGVGGFGRFTRGGRGGAVIKVTNLEDTGAGSLRNAIEQEGPRTIIFEVSGTISLNSELKIKKGFLTIAGQTAPGDGITLRNYGLVISANEVIVRYIRSRPGDDMGEENDAITVSKGSNIIIDHCSASWATDETLSISPSRQAPPGGIDRVTVQWCLISESLNSSVHSKGEHGYGSLVRGSAGSRYSFHHNLWAHHKARMPRPGNYIDAKRDPLGPLMDFRNNVFYNWGNKSSGYNADTTSISRYNFINNYYIRGANSRGALAFEESGSFADSHFSGNFMDHEEPANAWSLVRFKDGRDRSNDHPFEVGEVETDSAPVAFEKVLKWVGASLTRDAVDERLISHVRKTEGQIINDEVSVGGWPELESGTPKPDRDEDGLPDDWEALHDLNPDDPGDANTDRNNDGYTNLEEYINSLVPHESL
jgi:pectate lyase